MRQTATEVCARVGFHTLLHLGLNRIITDHSCSCIPAIDLRPQKASSAHFSVANVSGRDRDFFVF